MNRPLLPAPHNPPAARPLSMWNQLPQDRRQELTAILATILLKQLPARQGAPSEAHDERQ